jgi:hypothetical protein
MVAPRDVAEFQTLCNALERNDPTVTSFQTLRLSVQDGFGRRLGKALKHNTIVHTIEWNLSYLVSRSEQHRRVTQSSSNSASGRCGRGRQTATTRRRPASKHSKKTLKNDNDDKEWIHNELAGLIHWIQLSSTALRTVQFCAQVRGSGPYFPGIKRKLVQCILQAMAKNPLVRGLELSMASVPFPLLTTYLKSTVANTALQSLRINSYYFRRTENDPEAAAVADAIRLLPHLHVLELHVNRVEVMLERLVQHPLTSPVYLALHELTVDFKAYFGVLDPVKIDLLATIVQRSTSLQHLGLEHFDLYTDSWMALATMLKSNSLIACLKLRSCRFLSHRTRSRF